MVRESSKGAMWNTSRNVLGGAAVRDLELTENKVNVLAFCKSHTTQSVILRPEVVLTTPRGY